MWTVQRTDDKDLEKTDIRWMQREMVKEYDRPTQGTFLREEVFLKKSLTDLTFSIHLSLKMKGTGDFKI